MGTVLLTPFHSHFEPTGRKLLFMNEQICCSNEYTLYLINRDDKQICDFYCQEIPMQASKHWCTAIIPPPSLPTAVSGTSDPSLLYLLGVSTCLLNYSQHRPWGCWFWQIRVGRGVDICLPSCFLCSFLYLSFSKYLFYDTLHIFCSGHVTHWN